MNHKDGKDGKDGKKDGKELLEDLFRGEGALPRPEEEELEELRRTLQVFRNLPAPPPSPRVLQGVKARLRPARRKEGGRDSSRRSLPALEAFRAAFRESWLVKGLAAALLIQVLALPIVGAVSFWKRSQVGGKETRTGVDLGKMLDRHLPLREEIRMEPLPGGPGPALEEKGIGKGGERPQAGFAYRDWLVRENLLREKWFFFSKKKSRRKSSRRVLGNSPLQEELARLSREVARDVAAGEDPLDLALGLRALFLSGKAQASPALREAFRQGLLRLKELWERGDDPARVETTALLAEMELLDGGAGRKALVRGLTWLLREFALREERLRRAPAWVLADAAQTAQWALVLVNRNPKEAREAVRAELLRRLEGRGRERVSAGAALLRAFPGAAPQKDLLSLTGLPVETLRRLAREDPFLLLQLSWIPHGGGVLGEGTSSLLEEVFARSRAGTPRERALRLLAAGSCYAYRGKAGSPR